jgi:type II secretory pathway component PulF
MLFCSVTLAHMYLGQIVSTIDNFLGFKNPYILLIISIFVVFIYITLARMLEAMTQKLTKSITIDPEAEKYTQ